MTENSKIRVAVLYGGRSSEHEISCRSAKSVVAHLDRARFTVIPVGIDEDGQWFFNDETIFDPKQSKLAISNENSTSAIPHADPTQERYFDVVFPVLHGKYGEDGTVQGLLDLANIPYVGCGVLASALCMDKDISKQLAKSLNIPITDYITAHAYEPYEDIFERLLSSLSFPVFVKPANAGSSDGISKVLSMDDMGSALTTAFALDQKVLIEKAMPIRDIEIAVIQDIITRQPIVTKIAGEIINDKTDFYSHDAKYNPEFQSILKVPAEITDMQLETLQNYAALIFKRFECAGLARIDFFIDKESDEIIFNEINTLPGFTDISLFPVLWKKSGMRYKALLSHLIDTALTQ